ncbi:phosphotransferase family protein [Gordonia rhizosphera]|uniref:Aminoglycoside phosphotransferase domain-containing protein n=1 Tax=Gordonia rhizosphera NBRC 16068 TaxID=1108045 RepID=K6X4I0_9ACTN|nr:phosphotransferase [Gordonia rhizosphera]GAB93704.1 hypothetical protein GORHZ_241_00020 [Gordonia rhizosphera NBRC 16068]
MELHPTELVSALAKDIPAVAGLAGCVAAPCGAGQLADSYRIAIRYDTPGHGRLNSVFLKLPPTDEKSAATAHRIDAFERESYFYTGLAPHLQINTPQFLGHVTLPESRTGLVLSDLSAHTRALDQLTDGTTAQVESAMSQLAKLQAPYWDDVASAGGEGRFYNRTAAHIESLAQRYEQSWHRFGNVIGAGLDHDQRQLIERFGASCIAWAATIEGPRTLTHQDLRLDNLLWGAQAGAFLIDWQTLAFTSPAWDPAFLLGTALPPEQRRAVERGLLARHVDALAAHGIGGWTMETAWTEHRRLTGSVILAMIAALAFVVPTTRGFDMFTSLIDRGTRQALDLDLDDFLD